MTTCDECGTRHGVGEFVRQDDCQQAQAHRDAIEATKTLLAPLQASAQARLYVAAQHEKGKHEKRPDRCNCEQQYAAIDRGESNGLGQDR